MALKFKTHFQRASGSGYEWTRSEYSPAVPLGDVIYLDNTNGSDTAGYGYSPEAPVKTLTYALSLVTADKGAEIHCLPGHAESLTAAAAIAVNKAGVVIRSLGRGSKRATFTWSTSTAAQMTVTAAGVLFQDIIFDFTGVDAVVAGISVTAADVRFDSCTFVISNGTAGVVLGILTAATADRLQVENCHFRGPATSTGTTTTACIKHEVGVDYIIRNNIFTGKMTQAILNATTNLRGVIDNNRFVIGTGTVAVSVAAASTPFITNNRINVASGTAPIVAAAGFVAGNVYSAAAGVSAGVASTF